MNFPTLKKEIITNHYLLPFVEGLQDNKLILVTSLGLIVGTPISDESISELESGDDFPADKLLLKFMLQFAESYRSKNKISPDEKLPENDGFIYLENVRIISGGNTIANFPNLTVFYDQIIGVTIGNI